MRIINRLKDWIKRFIEKIISLKKPASQKEKSAVSNPLPQPVPLEVTVGESKYFTGPQPVASYQRPWELPLGYGDNRITLQVRDPWWLHTYWEVSHDAMQKLRRELGDLFYSALRVLRVYDVSHIIFNGNNAHRFFDIEINNDVNNWYIDTQGPGRSWCVDLGLRLADGRFITIVRSNTVHTPLDGPSWLTDEEWMIPEDMFARLYGLGVGLGSSPLKAKKLWQERLKREFGSGALFSVSSPVKKAQERSFWLAVNTELIVYGATEADAKLTVAGKPVQLRPDGTFSLRFALPDGKQVIPVEASSKDGVDEKTITPVVNKETK